MNCCDEYGNCRQGRDCPIRKHRFVEYNTGWHMFDNIMSVIAYGITIVGAIVVTLLLSCGAWYVWRV